jgi:hypothetical protein
VFLRFEGIVTTRCVQNGVAVLHYVTCSFELSAYYYSLTVARSGPEFIAGGI